MGGAKKMEGGKKGIEKERKEGRRNKKGKGWKEEGIKKRKKDRKEERI